MTMILLLILKNLEEKIVDDELKKKESLKNIIKKFILNKKLFGIIFHILYIVFILY